MVSLRTVLLLTAPLVKAFSNTSPFVAWSSSQSSSLEAISAQKSLVYLSDDVIGAVVVEDICKYDAVIVVEQPGLHASDLRTLPSDSYLARQLRSAPSSLDVPHLKPASPVGLGRSLAELCRSQILELSLDHDVNGMKLSGKQVIHVDIPELDSVGEGREEDMRQIDGKLSLLLSRLEAIFPSHFVIVAGTTSSSFNTLKHHGARSRSQLPVLFRSPSVSSRETALPKGGIFHRYQLLTPGLITTLGITFLLVMPLILLVVTAITGIKSPLRTEGLRQAQEKKNQ
jgi:hypothetical protein